MHATRPYVVFWSAVVIDVIALGFAWSAWKTPSSSPAVVVVALVATPVAAAASIVAGRILVVLSRRRVPRP